MCLCLREKSFLWTPDVYVCDKLLVGTPPERHSGLVLFILVPTSLQTDSYMKTEFRTSLIFSIKNIEAFPRELHFYSILIDQWVFEVSSSEFVLPASRYLRSTYFRRTRFPLVACRPMGFRGVWTSDSCFPYRDTSGKHVSDELDFHWFPADQWGFEVFGPRIHVPRIEIPQEKVFPANSISIGSRPTNGVSRCLGLGFMFPASKYPRKRCFRQTRFPLVPGRPMGFRGVWALDSCSPHRDTSTSIVTDHTKYPCR